MKRSPKDLVGLQRRQRLALMELPLDLDQSGTAEDVDRAWDDEIRARVKAIDEGRAVGISYELIKREMTERFCRR